MIILGNVLCVNMPRTDYAETDPAKASYLVNRPAQAIQDAAERAAAALPRSGGTMTGDIAMGGKKVTGLADPTLESDAASKGYVDGKKAALSVVLPGASWADNTQQVAAPGVTENNHVLVTAAPESFVPWGEATVRCTAQGAGVLSFACEEVPSRDLTANILIMN